VSSEKKISFSGVDNGLLALMQKIRATNEDIYNKTVRQAREFSNSGKEQTSFIQQQIKLLEIKNKTLEQEKQLIDETFRAGVKKNQQEVHSGRMTTSQYLQSTSELRSQKTSRLAALAAESNETKRTASLLRELIETVKMTAKEQIAQDREGVEELVDQDEKTQRKKGISAVSDEEGLIRAAQRDEFAKKEEKKSVFSEVLKANLVTELAKGIGQSIKTTANARTEDVLTPQIMGLAVQTTGTVVSGLIGIFSAGAAAAGIAFSKAVGETVNQLEAQHLEAVKELEMASNRARGTFGDRDISVANRTKYGYSSAQSMELARDIALSAGSAKGLSSKTEDAMAVERAYSLDKGLIMQMFKDARMTTTDMSMIQNVAQVVNMIPGLKRDPSKLGELLQVQSQILNQQGSLLEHVSRGTITKEMATLSKIGGSFANPQFMGQRLETFNQMLTSPQNEFAAARGFASLSKILGPNASYFDIIKARAQGTSQKGALHATIQQLEREVGGGENLALALTGQQFGGGGAANFSPEQAELILKAYKKNKNLFKGFGGSDAEALNVAGVGAIKERGQKLTTSMESSIAEITDAFADGVISGFTTALEKNAIKLNAKVKQAVDDFFKTQPNKPKPK
jgi:hypothetical protein